MNVLECSTYQELSGCIKELFIELNKKNGPVPFVSIIQSI